MREIQLTQGKVVIVDNIDYEYLMQWKWRCIGKYAGRTTCRPNRRTVLMHRSIVERMGFSDFQHTDHINRHGLDNRRCNLRPATVSQSMCNRRVMRNNTSGYRGVLWLKRKEKWQAKILLNRGQHFLGYFDDIKDAARAYNKAALRLHGEFANLNKV